MGLAEGRRPPLVHDHCGGNVHPVQITPMFDTFTDRARQTITLAQQESERFRHPDIGTEHLLLGLVKGGVGVAVLALTNLGSDLQKVRREVETLITKGDKPSPIRPLPFTPQAKRALDLAVEASRALGHPYVGTEHILLGLLADQDDVAARVLIGLGLQPDEVRSEILDLLGVDDGSQAPPPVSKSPDPADAPATEASKKPILPPTTEADARSKPAHVESDLFSNRALQVIALAQQEAKRFHHAHIDTEHLLLGLVQVDGGVTAPLLNDCGLDVAHLCRAIEQLASTTGTTAPDGPPTFAPPAKRVLELALVEARAHGIPYIRDEHILLGILAERDCTGATALSNLGIDPARFRQDILALLGANDVPMTVHHAPIDRSASIAASLRLHLQAKKEAESLGHEHIAPEHVHLALLNDHNNLAVQALRTTGVDPEALRQRIREHLKGRKQRPDGTFGPVEPAGGTGAADPTVT